MVPRCQNPVVGAIELLLWFRSIEIKKRALLLLWLLLLPGNVGSVSMLSSSMPAA